MPITTGRNWSTEEGLPAPLGAIWIADEKSYNFAIYSKYADEVTVLLYAADECTVPVSSYRFVPRRPKTSRVWCARTAAGMTHEAKYYSYSINGPISCGARFERHAFDPNKVLLDPYAKSVLFPPDFSRAAAVDRGSNLGKALLGALPPQDESATYDWGSDIRPRHDSDLIVYELHVRGFTQNENSGVSAQRKGTFLGLVDKIPYLLHLRVTAVELMPVFQFHASEPNYWGYMPLSFFAPHGVTSIVSRVGSTDLVPHRQPRGVPILQEDDFLSQISCLPRKVDVLANDVSCYGIGSSTDFSHESGSLAYCLRGDSEQDDDIYVLINASFQPLNFVLQEERTSGWFRVIITSLDSPDDIALEHESRERCTSKHYRPDARSIAVFLSSNSQAKTSPTNSQQPETYLSIQDRVATIHKS